jgi:flagellar protein FlbD
MIRVTRLNGTTFVINAELIRELEATPDTVVTLITGTKLLVRESVDDVINAVIEYRREIGNPAAQHQPPTL